MLLVISKDPCNNLLLLPQERKRYKSEHIATGIVRNRNRNMVNRDNYKCKVVFSVYNTIKHTHKYIRDDKGDDDCDKAG